MIENLPDSVVDRIKHLITGRTQKEIATATGVSIGYISHVLTRRRKPSTKFLTTLAQYTNCNMHWLMLGDGSPDMTTQSVISDVVNEPVKVAESSHSYNIVEENHVALEKPVNLNAHFNIVSPEMAREFMTDAVMDEFVAVPLLEDSVAAGPPTAVEENHIEGYAVIHRTQIPHPDNTKCVRVKGDSMHPVLMNGFIVAIDSMQRDPADLSGNMVALRYEDGITIKILHSSPLYYLFKPINPKADSYQIPIGDPCPILGKVIWWFGSWE